MRLEKVFRRSVVRDEGGAAIVEFAIAIVPVLLFFFGMAQMGAIAAMHLMVKHAAFVAARGDAVIHPGMGDSGDESGVKAAAQGLLPPNDFLDKALITVNKTESAPMSEQTDTVTVKLTYLCQVPLGNVVACGILRMHTIQASASFPNQGSNYQTVWPVGG